MKVPRKQSRRETPRTPQATLIPDQGTIPTNRKTVSRTQVGDGALVLPPESDSKMLRAKANGPGRKCVIRGDRGAERSVARIDPTVVSTARNSVAKRGENRAPARTFFYGGIAHDEHDKSSKGGTTYPKDAPWDGPCVHPYSCGRYHTENMGQGARSALGITV